MPPPSKGELRAQVEKLEAANAALRSKGREAGRNAKASARRIAELEELVAQLQAAAANVPAAGGPAGAARPARRRRSREIDPGDAVPPGVAVQDPGPLDEEAEAAKKALERHLPGK